MILNMFTPGGSGPNMVSLTMSRSETDVIQTKYKSAIKILYLPGISAETHQMLERALCITELHDTAHPIFISPGLLLFTSVFCVLAQFWF